MKIIAIANQKGGVGKTSTCLHIAGVLAERGLRLLVVDMDQQGNLSSVFIDNIHKLNHTIADLLTEDPVVEVSKVTRPTHIKNIDVLPANLTLSNLDARLAGEDDAQYCLLETVQEVQGSYDHILIDCPPNLGRATRMAFVAAEGILIPIECQDWAFIGSNQIVALIERVRKRVNSELRLLGFVINKYAPRRNLEQDYNQALRKQYGDYIFRTEFRNNVQYTEASTERLPITHYLPKSEQAEAYRQFVTELLHNGQKEFSQASPTFDCR